MTRASTRPSSPAGELVEDFFRAMAAGDNARLGEVLAADVTWSFPGDLPFSGVHVGRAAVFADLLGVSAPFFQQGHLRIDMDNVVEDGTVVMAEYTGHNVTAAGRPYKNNYVFVLVIEQGAIREIRSYCDTARMKDLLAT